MADEHEQPEQAWDEYEWESFLREQDLRTERYLELLERYVDHPERDMLIAREMGWSDAEQGEAMIWDEAAVGEGLEASVSEEEAGAVDHSEVHPLYQASFDLTLWLDEAFEARGERVSAHPASLELSRQMCILGGKLAAALSDPEGSELGMTIAYLKRALRAANLALNAYAEMRRERLFGRIRDRQLKDQIFGVRDGIVRLMGESRQEWRRRNGA